MSGGLRRESHAERADDLHDGLEARIAVRRERLVQAAAGDPGVVRELHHAACPRDDAKPFRCGVKFSGAIADRQANLRSHRLNNLDCAQSPLPTTRQNSIEGCKGAGISRCGCNVQGVRDVDTVCNGSKCELDSFGVFDSHSR